MGYKAAIRARGKSFARGQLGQRWKPMSTINRLLLVLLLVLVLGGTVFLVTWEIPPPTARVERVVPDDTVPTLIRACSRLSLLRAALWLGMGATVAAAVIMVTARAGLAQQGPIRLFPQPEPPSAPAARAHARSGPHVAARRAGRAGGRRRSGRRRPPGATAEFVVEGLAAPEAGCHRSCRTERRLRSRALAGQRSRGDPTRSCPICRW